MARSPLFAAVVLVLLVAPAGCGESPPSAPPPDTYSLTLSPVPLLEEATVRAAGLWAAETGLSITVGPGGVPVDLVAHCYRPDGSDAPGVTSAARDAIRINVRARASQRQDAILHEVGHVLGANDIEGDGVMGGGPAIDEAAVDAVCAVHDCPGFSGDASL